MRKKFNAAFKSKVALEALKGQKTMAQLAREYKAHPNQIGQWKKRVLEELPRVFDTGRDRNARDQAELIEELYRQIGQQKVELDWLKKKSGLAGRG